jgi:CBS domain-containing protein
MPHKEDNIIVLNASHVAKPLVSLESNKTFLDARNLMLRYNIKRIVVTSPDDKKAIGIITEKDIGKFLSNHLLDKRNVEEVILREFLDNNSKLYAVSRNSSLGICVQFMLDKNISSLLITGENNQVNKIITKTDLIALIAFRQFDNLIVSEYMTKNVITVSPEEDISIVLDLLNRYKISRIIVIKENKPIGIITGRDIIPKGYFLNIDGHGREVENEAARKGKLTVSNFTTPMTVKDIMTPNPLIVGEEASIDEAAKLIIENRISGIPVINKLQNLAGIITKTDIIRAIFDMGKKVK